MAENLTDLEDLKTKYNHKHTHNKHPRHSFEDFHPHDDTDFGDSNLSTDSAPAYIPTLDENNLRDTGQTKLKMFTNDSNLPRNINVVNRI